MRMSRMMLLCGGLLALGLMAGCSDDPAAPGTTSVSADMAEQWSTSALEMISAMTVEIPDIASGDMVPLGTQKLAGEPTWDAEQMAWVFYQEMHFTEGDPVTGTSDIAVAGWVQYRNSEGPLPSALGATEMEYRLEETMDVHSEQDGAVSDVSYAMATTMVVTYQELGYLVNGSGNAEVHASQTANGMTEQMSLAMSWGMELELPLGGCPAGTATVEMAGYRMQALYDGEGGVDWNLVGPNYQASGSDIVPCGGVY